jgi:hypothetical protein
VRDTQTVDDPSLRRQLVDAAAGPLVVADHRRVLADRQQERPGLGVGVARAEQGVDLQRGSAGVAVVHADAVVDDTLEHRQRTDPHPDGLANTLHPAHG